MSARPTILCVDDDQNVLDVLARLFERLATVLTATSGEAALAILRARTIDVLLTDQKMPGMTGIELAAAARAEGLEVTTILMTAYANPVDLIAAINEGRVFRYVTKPWEINDLSMTVRNALDYTALRRDKERLLRSLHKRIEALSVMYEVSRSSAHAPSLDAIVDRLLATVGRVLPHEVSAVLLDSGASKASLRIRCNAMVTEGALLHVQEAVLRAYRKAAKLELSEQRLITNVSGQASPGPGGLTAFASALSVPLIALGQNVGTLSLFASRAEAYTTDDGELLDLLVNQTTDAIGNVRAVERDARLRLEQMVESMGDGVVLADEQGAVLVVNAAARALLGLGREALTLEALTALLGASPFELVRGWEFGGQRRVQEERTLAGRDLRLIFSPVIGAGEQLRGVMLVLVDITEQNLLAQRKDEFVGMVSHELRTPLTSITGALDLVLGEIAGAINEKQRRFLDMARESTERLNALVDDLLDLSRYEQGAMRMAFELVHLDDLVKAALDRYGPALAGKHLAASLELSAQGAKLLADPNRLNQVLDNLLGNAIKFSPEHGAVKVTVGRSKDVPGSMIVSVWNSGDSIAEADLERIFDRFEQARTPKNRSLPGTGLGLSICRTIVQSHGGRIWAEPQAGGARFVVVLPEQPPEKAPGRPELPAQQAAGTVLLVEDEAEVAWVLKAMLLAAGYQVLIAANGEEALALARRHRPALISLDQVLPDYDGLKLLEIFRHDPDIKEAKVVVLSGLPMRDEALKAGAAAFIQKPVRRDSYLATLEVLARHGQQSRGRVLVVDDDAQIAQICVEVLSNQGFEVARAGSVFEARTALGHAWPDLLLLDVTLPDGDGFQFFEALKAERASSLPSVIFISARGETSAKVRALKLGGDDYLTKPFDALELGARVESVLRRRSAEALSGSATRLPGSAAIEREVNRRLAQRAPFAFCYLDLDNLKAFNDHYGFAKADGVVTQTADLLRDVVQQVGDGSEFVGHVAGDDFVFLAAPGRVDAICRKMIESFDRIIPLYYDHADRGRGSIEAEDRFGQRRSFPIMSVSIVAVMTDGTEEHPELARKAAELKKRAKALPGSVFLRSDAVPPASSPPRA